MNQPTGKPKFVVIGGGFAGLQRIQRLAALLQVSAAGFGQAQVAAGAVQQKNRRKLKNLV